MNDFPFKEYLSKIISDVTKYVRTRYDLAKLDAIEKLVLFSSFFITIVIIVLIIAAFLTFFSFTLAFYLSDIWQSKTLGFFAVTLLYFILGIIVIAFKEKLITNHILKILLKNIFKGNDN